MIRSFARGVVSAFVMFSGFIAGIVATYMLLGIASMFGFDQAHRFWSSLALLGGVLGAWFLRRVLRGARGSSRVAGVPRGVDHRETPGASSWEAQWRPRPNLPTGTVPLPAMPRWSGRGAYSHEKHVYGRIGGTMDQADFSDANVGAGLKGEQLTSELIEEIMEANPQGELYLFRGLTWPGSKNADIDFIVASSSRHGVSTTLDLWLVDAKMWKSGHYAWDGEMCWLNEEPYHEIRFEHAIRGVRRMFPGARVHADVVIHGAKAVDNTRAGSSGMRILTPTQFRRELKDLAATRHDPLPSTTGGKLAGLVKVSL